MVSNKPNTKRIVAQQLPVRSEQVYQLFLFLVSPHTIIGLRLTLEVIFCGSRKKSCGNTFSVPDRFRFYLFNTCRRIGVDYICFARGSFGDHFSKIGWSVIRYPVGFETHRSNTHVAWNLEESLRLLSKGLLEWTDITAYRLTGRNC